jgi:pimeloyl-ACP methyl ester carboxylesterase
MGYTAWGPDDAERTIVCMHGLTRNSRDFDFLAQRLAERGARVVAPDLPGRGRSAPVEHAEDYATPLYLAVGGALIAHLGNSEVDWVGTSLGGHIGMELAARPGSPIRRLVLNDFGARVPAAALQRIGSYHKTVRTFSTLNDAEMYLREIYASFGTLSDAQWRHLAEHSVIAQGKELRLNYDPKIVTQFSRPLFLDVTLWRVWEQVACSVLLLHGENSDLLLAGNGCGNETARIAARRDSYVSEIANCSMRRHSWLTIRSGRSRTFCCLQVTWAWSAAVVPREAGCNEEQDRVGCRCRRHHSRWRYRRLLSVLWAAARRTN